jgi:hypothetical protein
VIFRRLTQRNQHFRQVDDQVPGIGHTFGCLGIESCSYPSIGIYRDGE